jgi:hypothetical protein
MSEEDLWRCLADKYDERDFMERLDESKSQWEETMVIKQTQRWRCREIKADLAAASESQHHSIDRECKLTKNSQSGSRG